MPFSPEYRRRLLDAAAELNPAEYRALPERDRAAIAQAHAEQETLDEPLLEFIPRVSPGHLSPVHLRQLAELVDRTEQERLNVCVSVPPGHGKTDLLLHAMVRQLARHPGHLIGYATYGLDLSLAKSREARDIALRAGVTLRHDSSAVHEWNTTAGGGFKATGVGAGFTGRHIDLLVFDDPFKSREDAESPRERDRVHDFFTATATARCKENASRIVVHTRWHEDDLIGRLAKSERWIVVNLPAIRDPATGLPADDGEILLPPTRLPSGSVFGYSKELLAERRAGNEYDWHSLYQGVPRPRGGAVFKRDPARFTGDGKDGRRIVLSLDGAGTESTRADYTVAVAWAFEGTGAALHGNVVDMLRCQLEPQDSARLLRRFVDDNGGGELLIENTRDGKAIAKALAAIDGTIRTRLVPPVGDKFTRAQPMASAWNGDPSRVAIPADASAHPWIKDLLAETRTFTGIGDKHDDIVDALSQGWNAAQDAAPAVGSLDVDWMDR